MTEEKRDCTYCHGRGTVTETRTELDQAMSFALGAATGTGYLPQWKTVTETKSCTHCGGVGKVRR